MEKSVCGQCGKQFANKNGVKKHILRMHAGKEQRADNPTTANLSINVNVNHSPPDISPNKAPAISPDIAIASETSVQISTAEKSRAIFNQ